MPPVVRSSPRNVMAPLRSASGSSRSGRIHADVVCLYGSVEPDSLQVINGSAEPDIGIHAAAHDQSELIFQRIIGVHFVQRQKAVDCEIENGIFLHVISDTAVHGKPVGSRAHGGVGHRDISFGNIDPGGELLNRLTQFVIADETVSQLKIKIKACVFRIIQRPPAEPLKLIMPRISSVSSSMG